MRTGRNGIDHSLYLPSDPHSCKIGGADPRTRLWVQKPRTDSFHITATPRLVVNAVASLWVTLRSRGNDLSKPHKVAPVARLKEAIYDS